MILSSERDAANTIKYVVVVIQYLVVVGKDLKTCHRKGLKREMVWKGSQTNVQLARTIRSCWGCLGFENLAKHGG